GERQDQTEHLYIITVAQRRLSDLFFLPFRKARSSNEEVIPSVFVFQFWNAMLISRGAFRAGGQSERRASPVDIFDRGYRSRCIVGDMGYHTLLGPSFEARFLHS
ncbi:unnamed protein product, partial [Ectocarpus sp. 12 AP-2014]